MTASGYESAGSMVSQKTKMSSFYQKIKDEKSAPVRKILELFISRFYNQEKFKMTNRKDQSDKVQELISDLEDKFQEVHKESEEEQMQSAEGIESVVCKNLYEYIFNVEDEWPINEKIQQNILIHQKFVEPAHLELKPHRIIIENIKVACTRLAQWKNNKLPVGKLKCMIEFIKILQTMLNETSKDGQPDGADILLPTTIYALLQLNEKQSELLKSNLEFIRLFRHQQRLDGQDEYYLTNVESAAEFIYNLGPGESNLKMDQQEYDAAYDLSRQSILNGGNQEEVDLLNLSTAPPQQQQPQNQNQVLKSEGGDQEQQEADLIGLQDQSQQEEQKQQNDLTSQLAQENIFLKKMLNEFLEDVYRYRNVDFEELKIREQKEIYAASMLLVQKLSMITIDNTNQKQIFNGLSDNATSSTSKHLEQILKYKNGSSNDSTNENGLIDL